VVQRIRREAAHDALSDEQLMVEIQHGDGDAFAVLFDRYNRLVLTVALHSGYGKTIRLHRGDALVVHPSKDGRVVILEYEGHGTILATGAPYDNRFVSVVTIENRKIIRWREYMDSLAAWMALNNAS
jgi:hypothetical protein